MDETAEVVRWGNGPIAFEMTASDPEILSYARRVFRNWQPDEDAALHGRWTATRSEESFTVSPRRAPEDGEEVRPVRNARHAVTVVEYGAIWEIAETRTDILSFHSALLSRDGRGVAVIGASGSGKSTLAMALWQSGWRLHGDDLTFIINGEAFAGPRRVSLREESREHIGAAIWQRVPETPGYYKTKAGCLFQPMDLDGTRPEPVTLSALFFLGRNNAPSRPEFGAIDPAYAALSLLPYSNLSKPDRFPDGFPLAAEVTSHVPAWDLERRPVAQMVSTVERLSLGA